MKITITSKGTKYEVVFDEDVDQNLLVGAILVWGGGKKGPCRWPYAMTKNQKLIHREILKIPDGFVCDHIDGNTLNNRKANLRVVTYAQNTWNRKRNSTNSSGYVGVTPYRGRFVSGISHQCSRINLGAFNTPEEAAAAYDLKALELRGDFAVLNFPRENYAKLPSRNVEDY